MYKTLNVVIPLCLSVIKVYNYPSTQLFIVNYAYYRHVSTQPSHHQAILEPYLRCTRYQGTDILYTLNTVLR
jgi:hypothetical protein